MSARVAPLNIPSFEAQLDEKQAPPSQLPPLEATPLGSLYRKILSEQGQPKSPHAMPEWGKQLQLRLAVLEAKIEHIERVPSTHQSDTDTEVAAALYSRCCNAATLITVRVGAKDKRAREANLMRSRDLPKKRNLLHLTADRLNQRRRPTTMQTMLTQTL